jgi:hypothetical protein
MYRVSDVSLDRYPTVAIPNHGTSEMIEENLQTLRQIRRVYAKCMAVRNDVPVSSLNHQSDNSEVHSGLLTKKRFWFRFDL